jgi:hypothetical protein
MTFLFLFAGLLGAAVPSPGAVATVPPAGEAEQEVVVTARRTGIPVWSVRGPRGTLVLVSSIGPVPAGTRWEPGSLGAAVKQADRVLFLNSFEASISPVQALGFYLKYRSRAKLPAGQTLHSLLTPGDLQRLAALERRGIVKSGWERSNPFHLFLHLRRETVGGIKETAGATGYVRTAAKTHKVRAVPVRTLKAAPVLRQLLAAPPSAFVPCLREAITMAEAGPAAITARSRAWAERRVKDVLASPATPDLARCVPPDTREMLKPDLRPTLRALAGEAGATVAVVDIRALAERGGVLDHLQASGFEVRGPAWR